ncbi:uncharacterized protein LOC122447287 [Cervus canadensis]|uniref:uncharacterized protein LOC122447287 n=1 Tax=Cervus canadensis TaxID=1574408 RepID=UPI001C9E33D2|nr:uncharacterized protein LOC122447287 [Cervus canadensis]
MKCKKNLTGYRLWSPFSIMSPSSVTARLAVRPGDTLGSSVTRCISPGDQAGRESPFSPSGHCQHHSNSISVLLTSKLSGRVEPVPALPGPRRLPLPPPGWVLPPSRGARGAGRAETRSPGRSEPRGPHRAVPVGRAARLRGACFPGKGLAPTAARFTPAALPLCVRNCKKQEKSPLVQIPKAAMARGWTWTFAQGINSQNLTKYCWRMNIKQEVEELKSVWS